LARFVPLLNLVNNIDPPFAAHELIGAMTSAQGFEGIADFHARDPKPNFQTG
jgi:hypothetical protein